MTTFWPRQTWNIPPEKPPRSPLFHSAASETRSYFAVLAILLTAALFILLMAYFNQRRDYEAQIADLTNAFHAVQADNDELEAQNTALQNRFDNLKGTSQAKLDEVEDDLHDMLIEKYLLVTAWYADVLFQRGEYNECASVMRFIISDALGESGIAGENARTDTEEVTTYNSRYLTFP